MPLLCGVHLLPKPARAVIRLPPPAALGALHPFAIPPHNAAHQAPARKIAFDDILRVAGRVHALVMLASQWRDETFRVRSLTHSGGITPRITRRPTSWPKMKSHVSAVACMRLLCGAQVPLKPVRGARVSAIRPAGSAHVFPQYRRITPGITRPPARWRLMRLFVSRVGCMPMLDCGLCDIFRQAYIYKF